MSTFYDPAKIRELAAAGDPFWKGAAWVLDQQDAARIDTTDYDREWTRNVVAANPNSEEFSRLKGIPADTSVVVDAFADHGPLFSAEEVAARRRYRARKKAQAEDGDWDWSA